MSGFLAKVNSRAASTTRQTTGQSSVARTAAKNIRSSSTATGNVSGLRTSGRDFGIFAQRSVTGSGAQYDVKGYNSASLSAYRHSMNDNHTQVYNNFGFGGYTSNSSNGLNKFAAAMMAMGVLGDLANQAVTTVKSTKTSSSQGTGKTPSTDNATGTGSTASSSLSKMKAAKDSASLREAIEAGNAEYTQKQTELTSIESGLEAKRTASENASKQLAEIKPKVEAKENEVKSKESEVTKNKQDVTRSKEELNASETRLSSCDAAFNTACTNFNAAETALTSAEAALKATPEYTTDASGKQVKNPAYDAAKQKVEDAKQRKQEAQTAKEQAAGSLEQAKADNNTAKQMYIQKNEAYKNAEAALTKSQSELETLKTDLQALQDQQSNAQKIVDDYQKDLDKQKQLKAETSSLKSEIEAQGNRLKEMEQKESNGLKNAQNTILAMSDKLAGKDGILGTSDDKKKLKSKDQEKLNNAKTLQRNVGYTDLYKTTGEKVGGKTFRTGSYNGETLYMIGARRVDKAEYETEMRKQRGIEQDNPSS